MKKKFDYKSFKKLQEEAESTDEYWIEKMKLDFSEDINKFNLRKIQTKDYKISQIVKICREHGFKYQLVITEDCD
jgi:hypothetical protein